MLKIGIVTVFLAAFAGAFASSTMVLLDFDSRAVARQWVSVNDTVMGGLSSSRLEPTPEGTVIFTGTVSLENNGGFASVRTRPGRMDLRDFAGLTLRFRGDGNRYKINLKDDANLDGVLWRVAFDTVAGEWQTVRVRFDDFVPTFRGRRLADVGPLDLANVASVGLMISDSQDGPFRLELAPIEVFEE